MKVIFSILLSTLCLAFSTTSSANIDRLVESCAMSHGYYPNNDGGRMFNSEGYRIEFFHSKSGDNFSSLRMCVTSKILEKAHYSSGEKRKEFEEISNSLKIDEASKSIVDPKDKIQFNFTFKNPPTREEICADLKGKPKDYAFCMGTKTYTEPTCKNSNGDPCGSSYDKSRSGYDLKEN